MKKNLIIFLNPHIWDVNIWQALEIDKFKKKFNILYIISLKCNHYDPTIYQETLRNPKGSYWIKRNAKKNFESKFNAKFFFASL